MRFTQDWFTKNIPVLELLLAEYAGKANVCALEIGCFEGLSTRWFLEHVLTGETSRIHVVDTFAGSAEHASLDTTRLLETFCANVMGDFSQNVVVHRGMSQELLPTLRSGSFDFIYVDGSHKATDVLIDAVQSWLLLKDGGVLLFDDYEWRGIWPGVVPERERPRLALDAFLHVFAGEYRLVHTGYMLALKKEREAR